MAAPPDRADRGPHHPRRRDPLPLLRNEVRYPRGPDRAYPGNLRHGARDRLGVLFHRDHRELQGPTAHNGRPATGSRTTERNTMRALAAVLFAAALAGCGSLNPFGPGQELAVPTNLSETGQEAAKLINGIKVGLIVANNTVAQQASEGLMLKSEAVAARSVIDNYWKQVKQAQALLVDG